jgi:hypothetical protein
VAGKLVDENLETQPSSNRQARPSAADHYGTNAGGH